MWHSILRKCVSVTRFRFACHELFEQRVFRHLTLTSWLGVLKTDKVGMQNLLYRFEKRWDFGWNCYILVWLAHYPIHIWHLEFKSLTEYTVYMSLCGVFLKSNECVELSWCKCAMNHSFRLAMEARTSLCRFKSEITWTSQAHDSHRDLSLSKEKTNGRFYYPSA